MAVSHTDGQAQWLVCSSNRRTLSWHFYLSKREMTIWQFLSCPHPLALFLMLPSLCKSSTVGRRTHPSSDHSRQKVSYNAVWSQVMRLLVCASGGCVIEILRQMSGSSEELGLYLQQYFRVQIFAAFYMKNFQCFIILHLVFSCFSHRCSCPTSLCIWK
jgi:hypothetical protein